MVAQRCVIKNIQKRKIAANCHDFLLQSNSKMILHRRSNMCSIKNVRLLSLLTILVLRQHTVVSPLILKPSMLAKPSCKTHKISTHFRCNNALCIQHWVSTCDKCAISSFQVFYGVLNTPGFQYLDARKCCFWIKKVMWQRLTLVTAMCTFFLNIRCTRDQWSLICPVNSIFMLHSCKRQARCITIIIMPC